MPVASGKFSINFKMREETAGMINSNMEELFQKYMGNGNPSLPPIRNPSVSQDTSTTHTKLIDWRFIRILAKEAEDFPGFIKWKPKEKTGA